MGTAERRNEIMRILCRRRHESISNLADEFGVSTRTILRDIEVLSIKEPIYTQCGRYGGGGMMNGGMNQMQQMHGKNPILGRIQLISSAALDAVAAESTPGMDNKPDSALKVYAKKKAVELVLTPILLVLAISGALVDLGFLIGDLLVDGISQIGNMI